MWGMFRAALALGVIAGQAAGAAPPVAAAAPVSVPASAPASAQTQAIGFSSIPGIPRNVVASLAQDRTGFLWIGTADGLARFDGVRLQFMESEGADPVSRNMGWVRAMAPGADGRFWIGTESHGLAVHEPGSGLIRIVGGIAQSNAQPGEGAPLPPIVGLAVDREGHVWMATQGGGLQRYTPKDGRISAVRLPGLYDGSGRVTAVHEDSAGTLWVGYWNGLARRRAGETGFSALALPPLPTGVNDPVMRLTSDAQGHLWFGTQSGRVGWWHAQTQVPHWLAEGPLPRGAINALRMGPDGRLWVGHRLGIDLIDPRTGDVVHQLRPRPGDPLSLAGSEVTTMLVDREGAMWVGGFGLGLQRHRPHPAIAVRGADPDASSPLARPDVRVLLGLRDGRVLAAVHGGAVVELDDALRVRKAWQRQGRALRSMVEAPDGTIWLGSVEGVEAWSPEGRLLRRLHSPGGSALRLVTGPDGTLWMGAQQGVFRLDPDATEFDAVPLSGDPRPHLERDVHGLALAADGTLWVGGLAGLQRLPPGARALQTVVGAPGEGLGKPTVLGLVLDAQQRLWVDTPVAGLHRLIGFDAQGRARFDPVSVRHGVVGKPFGANLEVDAKGRIWSQQFVFDPSDDRLEELEPGAGNFFGTPWFRSHTQSQSGKLIFGGSNGILVLNPSAYPPPPPPPPLAFTRLRVNGLPQQPGAWAAGLRLPAGTQSFGVEYAGLALGDAQRLRYRHRLLGLEADWVPGDAAFRAPSYSNLAPGRYTLQVQVSSSGGADERWSEPLELDVELAAYWWQWRSVQALAVLLALGGLALFIRWRGRQQRRHAAELEQLVAQRTAALREASLTDPLTGLRNRRFLAQRIDADLAHAREGAKKGEDLLVFLIDLDHFKRINDQHGHGPGDEVLFAVGQRLREVFAEDDLVTRWGGEEFLVVVPKRSRSDAPLLARLLLAAVREGPVHVGGGRLVSLSTSVGYVAYPPVPEQPEAWSWAATLDLADAALFDAKARGRDRAVGVLDTAGLTPAALGPEPGRWLLDPRLKPHVGA